MQGVKQNTFDKFDEVRKTKENKLTHHKFFNPLTANDELSRHENLTFLRDLDTEMGTQELRDP